MTNPDEGVCSGLACKKRESDSQRTSHRDRFPKQQGEEGLRPEIVEAGDTSNGYTDGQVGMKWWCRSRMQYKVVGVLRCIIPDLPYIANLGAVWGSVPGYAYLGHVTGSPVVSPRLGYPGVGS
jgi:hypothetical protein